MTEELIKIAIDAIKEISCDDLLPPQNDSRRPAAFERLYGSNRSSAHDHHRHNVVRKALRNILRRSRGDDLRLLRQEDAYRRPDVFIPSLNGALDLVQNAESMKFHYARFVESSKIPLSEAIRERLRGAEEYLGLYEDWVQKLDVEEWGFIVLVDQPETGMDTWEPWGANVLRVSFYGSGPDDIRVRVLDDAGAEVLAETKLPISSRWEEGGVSGS